MSANIYSFYNDAFWGDNVKDKGYLPFEIFKEQGNMIKLMLSLEQMLLV
ncbi:hypothetical protein [Spiroplasma endosymbiont of Polydrusus formosus]